MNADHDCTKCYRPIPNGSAVEAFGVLYHKACAPRNVRNFELAVVLKNDPTRLRTRTVETEPRKLQHNRAKRKAATRRELRDWS